MNSEKKNYIYKMIMGIVVSVFVTFVVTTAFFYNNVLNNNLFGNISINSSKNKSESNESLDGLEENLKSLRTAISNSYIGEIKDEDLYNGAIKGYVEGLGDKYTEYYTKEEMKEFLEDTTGKYVGIGIYMVVDDETNLVKILSPIKGTPAYEAGLKAGDLIKKIDDKEYTGDQMTEASNYIKGEEGTKVKLEILRGTETLNFEIERKKVHLIYAEGQMLENNIGYIYISNFNEDSAKQFLEEYKKLENNGVKSLIIDLRNNGGGIVDESLDIANYMIDKGETLMIKTSKNSGEEYSIAEENKVINVPIVVLTNEYSASASEILAGALKEKAGAKIVGNTTYGKGVIQTLYTLKNGCGIKITTNEYFTPNHTKINGIGIKPDYEIDLPEKSNALDGTVEDTQLNKAIELLK